MPTKKKTEAEEIKLEDAMTRLDDVVRALDGDGRELEDALKLYEEGVRLVRICHEKLSEAERKVKVLKLSAEGEMTEADFDNSESR